MLKRFHTRIEKRDGVIGWYDTIVEARVAAIELANRLHALGNFRGVEVRSDKYGAGPVEIHRAEET